MAIIVKDNHFHLKTKNTSYVMGVYDSRYFLHYYWGKALSDDVDLSYMPHEVVCSRANAQHVQGNAESTVFVTDFQYEFSVVGGGDYRPATVEAVCQDGSPVLEFEYNGYKETVGKEPLSGLPFVYSEEGDKVESLEIELVDRKLGLYAYLTYTVFVDYDAITRSIRFENRGGEVVKLTSAQSVCVDMPGQEYNVLHLHGDWSRECNREVQKVPHGSLVIDSKRGMSSHFQNPFVALMSSSADETCGDVYGFSLVYSGNFVADINGDSCGGTRVTMGINHFNFCWNLGIDEAFQTPEVVMVHSGQGLGGMSRKYHRLYRERLCRGVWRDKERPIVINNWEGTTFSFDEDIILKIAENGAKAGAEMFVLDDGWFGKRDDDKSSLGDWFVYEQKLPGGLGSLADKINRLGLKFGLWFEPEMISPNSELYRNHPDWCIHAEGRRRTENRWQLILDLSRQEVCDYVVDVVSKVLASANIEYVKWDCNRNFTETASCEQAHRFVLGLYYILEKLTSTFPNVLFEGCSSGGGRFDPGMLYYMPQTWTSDETTPVVRMSIQTGTSIVYPAISMTAHIASGVTNCAMGHRKDFMNTAAYVAMAGTFGLEMDLRKLSDEEIELAKSYVNQYKDIRSTVQFGEMYRLETGENNGNYSFQFADDERVVVFTYQSKPMSNWQKRRVYLRGLEADTKYLYDGREFFGSELMDFGFNVTVERYEYASKMFVFEKL